MGSVVRKTYTKPIPLNAQLDTDGIRETAVWTDKRGKSHKAPVVVGKDGTRRVRLRVGTYTAKFRDGCGIMREVPTGCREKSSALATLSKLEKRAEKVRSGVLSETEDRVADHLVAPLANHISEYRKYQKARDVACARVKFTYQRLTNVAAACGFSCLSDVVADKVEAWMQRQKADGMSPATRNGYREAWIGFCNWCVRNHRMVSNPLSNLSKANPELDRRRKRRAMTEDELKRLLEAASSRPLWDAQLIRRGPNKGQPLAKVSDQRRCELVRLGQERALIYKTLVLTGLRKGELASLTIGQCDLDGPIPLLHLNAADEKNRAGNSIPIRQDLADDLKEWIALRASHKASEAQGGAALCLPLCDPLFNVPTGLLRILDRDLEAAGIPKRDGRGRTLDVHALRHTFGTHLSKGGVPPRTAQAAMRHSDIDLTMNTYTDPKLLDVHGALNVLPSLPLSGRAKQAQEQPAAQLAPVLALDPVQSCQSVAQTDQTASPACDGEEEHRIVVTPSTVNQKHPLSTRDNGWQKVGVTGSRLNRWSQRSWTPSSPQLRNTLLQCRL